MVPSMMEELLFDDILYGDRAREEHGRIRRVFQILGSRSSTPRICSRRSCARVPAAPGSSTPSSPRARVR
jgi:hypothetical protein